MTVPKILPTLDRVKELLSYDPETGEFRWRVGRGGSASVGSLAGRINTKGYRQITIDRRSYVAHRLAWLITSKEWPLHQLDHINGIKGDNRIINLRAATNSQNQQNRGLRSDNLSGFSGVHFDVKRQLWQSQLCRLGGSRHLGYFDTLKEAVQARHQAEIVHFGEFRRC